MLRGSLPEKEEEVSGGVGRGGAGDTAGVPV